MITQNILWLIFGLIIAEFLIVDLGYFNRQAHKISTKSSLIQTLFWIGISLVFALLIFLFLGHVQAAEFLSAYVTEKMLSVDNLFVIMMIFSYFKLEEKYHHKILFWGILGAVVLRGLFIGLGSIIIEQFHWILYVFGAFLVYTGIKLLKEKDDDEDVDFNQSRVAKIAKKFLRFSTAKHDGHFTVMENGQKCFTLMFLILILVETTDIIFAVDSIPAVFSITQDPFLVFTSNMFAVMGLRALFFLVENILKKFHHLQKGVSFVLVFIGAKMLGGIFHLHISPILSLAIILLALGGSLVLSVLFPKKS